MLEPRTKVRIEILLAKKDDDDAQLMIDALEESLTVHITCVDNGEEALAYLQHKGKHADALRPNLFLLMDWNLRRMNGHEVLTVVEDDAALSRIPIVIMTSSGNEGDFRTKSYKLHAICCVAKPTDQEEFALAVKEIEQFWLKNLPHQ